jgi:hypothetical protein
MQVRPAWSDTKNSCDRAPSETTLARRNRENCGKLVGGKLSRQNAAEFANYHELPSHCLKAQE